MFNQVFFDENIKYECYRKFFHISSLVFLLLYKVNLWIGFVASLFFMVIYLILELLRVMQKKLFFLGNISEILVKTREVPFCKIYLSPIFLIVSMFCTYFFIAKPFSYIGIFSACIGDGLASLFGKLIPSFKLVNNKTFAGSISVFVVAFIVCYYFVPNFGMALIVGMGAMLVELFDFAKYDNLFLPVGVATLSFLLVT
ncbi:Putative membrane spanning protein [Borrelia crocidurae DOU]|uniref:Membrane spanning protein n=1 Tax=Borrelia crocidurae DOU TaxID=1293575 RepID=W5SN13_9SPIR|nr:membrane protein [Borrelia crocidurae]AHH06476.1 Putative membrane spanning protein [Borrelia crocidurae DOU]